MISQCGTHAGSRNQKRRQTSGAISRRQIHRLGVRSMYRFKPLDFVENQTGADSGAWFSGRRADGPVLAKHARKPQKKAHFWWPV